MRSKIVMVLSIVFGIFMANSGLKKFTSHMPTPEFADSGVSLMTAMGNSGWLIPLIALIEIGAGIMLIIGRTRPLGAIMMLPITTGIMLFHMISEPSGMIIGLAVFLLNAFLIFENREKYMPMING